MGPTGLGHRRLDGPTAPESLCGRIDQISVDPLTCPRCLAPMKVVALIEQPEIIRQILHHLKLGEVSQRAPPPRLLAHKLDQLLASLSPEQARQIQLSTDSIFWDDVPTWPDS